MTTTFDVAIVGFGPSGAVAAALLGQAGLRTFVCDRDRQLYDKPRAIVVDHEILRVFQQIGVAERVAAFMEPFTDSCFYGVDGQLIKQMSTAAQPYPLAHPPSMVFTQPLVETALRRRVAELSNVEVALGLSLIELTQDAESVTLELIGDDGSARSVKARFLIGCDGASSTVRQQAGILLEDLGFDEPWLVVDVLVNERGLAKLPTTSVQYCEPKRPCTMVIGPKNHRRWEFSLKESEDPRQMATPEGAWSVLKRWLTPGDAQLWRQASYRFHALVADRWRVGRVFVAGDAAHQQPPFLGQGMCQGVRDAANLAWKLRAVIEGRANEKLLDTYGAERKGHVVELTKRIKHIGELVGERDIERARARDARLLAECGGVVTPMPRQEVQPALGSGLISSRKQSAAGTLFPQPWLLVDNIKCRLDTLAGNEWRLVLSRDAPLPVRILDTGLARRLLLRTVRIDSAPAAGVLRETEGVTAAWFRKNRCSAALVRPDNYVYGTADSADALDALWTELEASIS